VLKSRRRSKVSLKRESCGGEKEDLEIYKIEAENKKKVNNKSFGVRRGDLLRNQKG